MMVRINVQLFLRGMLGSPNGGGSIVGGSPGALAGIGGGPSLGTSCPFSTGGGGIGGNGATIS